MFTETCENSCTAENEVCIEAVRWQGRQEVSFTVPGVNCDQPNVSGNPVIIVIQQRTKSALNLFAGKGVRN